MHALIVIGIFLFVIGCIILVVGVIKIRKDREMKLKVDAGVIKLRNDREMKLNVDAPKERKEYISHVNKFLVNITDDIISNAMERHPNSRTLKNNLMTLSQECHYKVFKKASMLTDTQIHEFHNFTNEVGEVIKNEAVIICDQYDLTLSRGKDVMYQQILLLRDHVYAGIADDDSCVSQSQLQYFMNNRVEVKTTELINLMAINKPDEIFNDAAHITAQIRKQLKLYIHNTYTRYRTLIAETACQVDKKDMKSVRLLIDNKVSSISM
jgi:hypothetical protein